MTSRIEQYLEGRIAREALTPEERREADTIARVVEETRVFVEARPVPDLTAGVLRRIAKLPPPAPDPENVLARLGRRLWAPRELSLQVRPVFAALAAAAVIALAVFVPSSPPAPIAVVPAGSSASPSQVLVQFRLEADGATTVRLAGSFTNWQPTYDLHQAAPGLWTITVPLSLGVHDYVFVIDVRQWVADPYAPRIDDGFGGTNSRLAL